MSETTTPDLLEIVRYPDPVLRRSSAPVLVVDDEVRTMAERMVHTMHASHGLGLSANQVGWLRRVVVVSATGEPENTRVALDPEILSEEGSVAFEEGCLSFPGLFGLITRPERIRVRYMNLAGETVTEDADGMLARCFLHEIDHLDGVLFITRMTPADRMRVKRALRELEEKYEGSRRARR